MTLLAGLLARALEDDWGELSEEIGLWIPVQITNKEHDDKPEGEVELGNKIVSCSVQILCVSLFCFGPDLSSAFLLSPVF